MKLSEMRELLTREDIQLTKSLGQNFLHDGNQLRRIVAAAELSKADKVLEIGPGLGPLTELLLQNAGEVLAIEKDGRLVEVLQHRFHANSTDSSRGIESSGSALTKSVTELLPLPGGLELLGKQRKEFAGGEGPQRAERAGASESLGRGEGNRKLDIPDVPPDATGCNACDNCLSPRQTFDGTIAAQKFLSCVYRIREKSGFGVGVQHIVEVLCGAETDRIRKWEHHTLSTYNIGSEHSRPEWAAIGREHHEFLAL
jgi:hypothetical protein